MTAREAYFLYVERAMLGAKQMDTYPYSWSLSEKTG